MRNIAIIQPYFHSGQVWSLEESVTVMGSAQLGIKLNKAEINDMTAFLQTLTDKQPKIAYPIQPPSPDQTPHPQPG